MASRIVADILSLPTVIVLEISYFLDVETFLKFRHACKSLKKLTCSEEFFQVYIRNTSVLKFLNLRPETSEAETFYTHVFYTLSKQLNFKKEDPLELIPIGASSSYSDQFIYATAHDSQGFWSSLGTTETNKEEYLFYRFDCELAVPTMVIVEFFYFRYVHQGGVMIGNPVFPSKFVQVELSLVPDKPIYISPKYEVKDKIKDTVIKIPIFPNLLWARYLKVKFYGMQCKHTLKDNLYYVCVDSVVCYGYHSEYESQSGYKFGKLLKRATANFYNMQKPSLKCPQSKEMMIDESEEKENEKLVKYGSKMIDELEEEKKPSFELDTNGYDLSGYNAALMRKVKEFKELESLLSFLENHLQLLEYSEFYEYLRDNEELAISYIISQSKKHNFLDANVTKMLIELVYDFKNNVIGKHEAPIGLFEFFLIRNQACEELIARKLELSNKAKSTIAKDADEGELLLIDSFGLIEFLQKRVSAARKAQKASCGAN